MRGWFDSKTFEDHNGQPSFVRKSLAWLLLFGGGLILLGVMLFGLMPLDVSKEVASFIMKALAAMTGVMGIAYGAMQGAKGYAQGQAAKGGAAGHQGGPTPRPSSAQGQLPDSSGVPDQATASGDASKPSGQAGQATPSAEPQAKGKAGA